MGTRKTRANETIQAFRHAAVSAFRNRGAFEVGRVLVLELTLERIGQDDYAVIAGIRLAGRIMLKPKAFGASVWLWTITGPYVSPTMQPSHGEAESLEDAKVAFKSKWQALHDLAEKSGQELRWIGDH